MGQRTVFISRSKHPRPKRIPRWIRPTLLLVLGAVLTISLLPIANVRSFDVRGMHATSDSVIESAIAQGLSGSTLGFISHRRWLWSSTGKIQAALADLPTLTEAHVWKVLPGRITISITEDKAAAIVTAPEHLYLVTDDGAILAIVGDPTRLSDLLQEPGDAEHLYRISIETSTPLGVGEHLFTAERAQTIYAWMDQMRAHQLSVDHVTLPSAHAPDMTASIAPGWDLRVDPTGNAEATIAAVSYLLETTIKDQVAQLGSIDARNPTALYYKLK